MDLIEVARLVTAVGRADMDAVRATRDVLLLELASAWAADAVMTGLRKTTLNSYRISIALLARAGIRTVGEATPLAVRAFLRARVGSGLSPETANRNLAALTSLLSWLHAEGRVPLAQVLELRELFLPRPGKPRPDYLVMPRYLRLREVAREVEPRGQLDLLLAFGVEAGLRYHEAVQLWGEDLDLDHEDAFVNVSLTHGRTNKKRRERTSPIRAVFARELRDRGLPRGPLFPARQRKGETLLSSYLHRNTFKGWREASAETLGWWWDWHLLRHTFASWNVQTGGKDILPKLSAWMDTSIPVLMKHYAALIPGGDKAIERAFERAA